MRDHGDDDPANLIFDTQTMLRFQGTWKELLGVKNITIWTSKFKYVVCRHLTSYKFIVQTMILVKVFKTENKTKSMIAWFKNLFSQDIMKVLSYND